MPDLAVARPGTGAASEAAAARGAGGARRVVAGLEGREERGDVRGGEWGATAHREKLRARKK